MVHYNAEREQKKDKIKLDPVLDTFVAIRAKYYQLQEDKAVSPRKGSDATSNGGSVSKSHSTKVVLPDFGQNVKSWTKFISLHNSLIHENQTLSVSEKFNFLAASTTGKAKATIVHLSLSDENYVLAYYH